MADTPDEVSKPSTGVETTLLDVGTTIVDPQGSGVLSDDGNTLETAGGDSEAPGANSEGDPTDLDLRARASANNGDQRSLSTADKPSFADLPALDPSGVGSEALGALEGFDPEIHATNPDGSPKLKAGGGFQKRRGRKPGNPAPRVQVSDESEPDAPKTAQENGASKIVVAAPVSPKIIAQQYASVFFALGFGAFGDEWLPESAEEKKMVETSIQTYVESEGVEPMSPGVGLVITLGAYALKKAQRPVIKSKLEIFKEKIKLVLQWIKVKRGG